MANNYLSNKDIEILVSGEGPVSAGLTGSTGSICIATDNPDLGLYLRTGTAVGGGWTRFATGSILSGGTATQNVEITGQDDEGAYNLSIQEYNQINLNTDVGDINIQANGVLNLESDGMSINADTQGNGTLDMVAAFSNIEISSGQFNLNVGGFRLNYQTFAGTTVTLGPTANIVDAIGGKVFEIDGTSASLPEGTIFQLIKRTGGDVTINMTSGNLTIPPSTGGQTSYTWNPGVYGACRIIRFSAGGSWMITGDL